MPAIPVVQELAVGQSITLTQPEGRWVNATGADASGVLARKPIALFVDPQDSSGFAADSNTGATANNVPAGSGPILTTAENNARMRSNVLDANKTIAYLSDDAPGVFVDYLSLDFAGFTLTFLGTVVVLATTSITAATPIAPASQQREVLTTALADLTAFILTGEGGSSAVPTRFLVTSGPRAGNTAWLVTQVTGEGGGLNVIDCTRPTTPAKAAGTIALGDSVDIVRGSFLAFAPSSSAQTTSAGNPSVTLQNLALRPGSSGPQTPFPFVQGFQTSVDELTFSVTGFACFVYGSGGLSIASLLANVTLEAGAYIAQLDFGLNLSLGGDCYVTGLSLGVGPQFFTSLLFFAGIGSGAQFQDLTGSAAIQVFGDDVLGVATDVSSASLLWGNGNAGPGLLVWPGATAIVSAGTPPTVTGSGGEFAFQPPNGGAPDINAWSFDEAATGTYVNRQASSWAALTNAALLNFNAHYPATNAHVIAR